MLTLTGKTLDVTSETVQGPTGSFVSTTITVMTGSGADTRVEHVRAGRDLPTSQLPKAGQDVALEVFVKAYPLKSGGAAFSLTATACEVAGSRVAPGPSVAPARAVS